MAETLAPDVANFIAKEQRIVNSGKPIPEKLSIPSYEQIPLELRGIAERIEHISGSWNPVEIYTADASKREEEEKKVSEAFDRGEEYNPSFTYSYASGLNLSSARQLLHQELSNLRHFGEKKAAGKTKHGGRLTLDRTARLFRSALYFKIKDDLATCDLVDGIKNKDDEKISVALKQKYPGTEPTLMTLAEQIYEKATREGDPEENMGQGLLTPQQAEFIKNMQFDAEGIKNAFEWLLKDYGIFYSPQNPDGFKVKVDKNASGIDVRDKSAEGPTVFIPEKRKVNGVKLLGLMAHEIERHAVQSVNGRKLFRLGGGALKIDNEQLYEGLGLRGETDINKKLFGIQDAGPRPYYPFAVKLAEEGASFFKIYSDQVERRLRVALKKPVGTGLPSNENINPAVLDKAKKNAWDTTYRVMRGHTDTKNTKKFAMAKDLGYLRGYQIDRQLREKGIGHLNEAGIIASGGLQYLAEFQLTPDRLPHPFKDATTRYCMEVMLPQIETAA